MHFVQNNVHVFLDFALKIWYNIIKGVLYMTVSAKKLASNARYRDKQEFIQLRVQQGERDRYKRLAEKLGVSVNQLFLQAVEEFISEHIAED